MSNDYTYRPTFFTHHWEIGLTTLDEIFGLWLIRKIYILVGFNNYATVQSFTDNTDTHINSHVKNYEVNGNYFEYLSSGVSQYVYMVKLMLKRIDSAFNIQIITRSLDITDWSRSERWRIVMKTFIFKFLLTKIQF